MRAIYLIRHGEPAFPEGKRCCLGRLDLSLSEKGRSQAALLQNKMIPLEGSHVLSSPLKRCTETAESAGFGHFIVESDFAEVDTGLWDGLTFDEIRQKWPEEYKRRGVDEWNEPFPNGESLNDCFLRASKALNHHLEKYPAGDLFIFAHRGVIQALYAHLTGKSRREVLSMIPDYCTPVVLLMDGDKMAGEMLLKPLDVPEQFPDELECAKILRAYGTPKNVIEHCQTVGKKAVQICNALNERGNHLNVSAAGAAGRLHDIARADKQHAEAGAKALFNAGYYTVAPIVADHMELPIEEEYVSEKSIVFLADKTIKETEEVSLEERYLSGREGQALSFAENKLVQAERVQKMVEGKTGM